MYVDSDEHGRRWVSTRDVTGLQDPVRKAAETLAADIETYLYDANSPYHRDPRFMAVALRRFDLLKMGSGNYADSVGEITEEIIAEALVDPYEGAPQPKSFNKGTRIDTAIRLNKDDRELLAAEKPKPAAKKESK